MARSVLAVQPAVVAGLNAAFTAADALGHTIVNNGRTALIVKNGSAASINVTITPGGTAGGYVVTPVVVAIAAAEEGYIGSFPAYPFNTTGGLVQVDFSAVTSVTVAAISL